MDHDARPDPYASHPAYAEVCARIDEWHADAARERLLVHASDGVVHRVRNAVGRMLIGVGRTIAVTPEARRRVAIR